MHLAASDNTFVISVADKLVVGTKDSLKKLTTSDLKNIGLSDFQSDSLIVILGDDSEVANHNQAVEGSQEHSLASDSTPEKKTKLSAPHNVGLVSTRPDLENTRWFAAVAVSSQGNYVAAASHLKTLFVYKVKDESGHLMKIPLLTSTQNLTKRSMALTFSKDEKNIIVADMQGDAYAFGTEEKTRPQPLTPILGHLSVVTDVKLSPDEKFILTGDRDEKIRVSHYPLSDDIQSFCLGHTKFVTKLAVPNDVHPLVFSGSGDATIRAFNYLTGTELGCVSCTEPGLISSPYIVTMACRFPYVFASLNQQPTIFGYHVICNGTADAINSVAFTSPFQLQQSSTIRALAVTCDTLLILQNDPKHPVASRDILQGSDTLAMSHAEEETTAVKQVLLRVLAEQSPGQLDIIFRDPLADLFSPTYGKSGDAGDDSSETSEIVKAKSKKRPLDSVSSDRMECV